MPLVESYLHKLNVFFRSMVQFVPGHCFRVSKGLSQNKSAHYSALLFPTFRISVVIFSQIYKNKKTSGVTLKKFF